MKKHIIDNLNAKAAKEAGLVLPPATSAEEYLSPNEAAEILGLTGEAIKQWIYRRKLPAVKLANGYWKIRKSDFEAYLAGRKAEVKPRLLLVGFDTASQIFVERFHLIRGQNLADTLLKALDERPSLAVVNLDPPESLVVVKKLRARAEFKHLPCLGLARNTVLDIDELSELGFKAMLNSSTPEPQLLAEVERLLRAGL